MSTVKRDRRTRKERRFMPQSAINPMITLVGTCLAAGALGAGMCSKFILPTEWQYTQYLLIGGAGLFGLVMWAGTSGDSMLRVGDPGVAIDRETTIRLPWGQITSIDWDEKNQALRVIGKDESQASTEILARVKTQPGAAAWILKEATERIPNVIDLNDGARNMIREASEKDGEILTVEPLQVAGKKCAKSGKAITYAKDARVCPRCERIYHRKSMPELCKCGASMKDVTGDEEDDEDAA